MIWYIRRVLRALRAPLRRPLEPLLWVAAMMSAKDVWALPAAPARGAPSAGAVGRRRSPRGVAPLLIVVGQAQLDGTRWQVMPAYFAALTCTAVGCVGRLGAVTVPSVVCRVVAFAGAAATTLSTAAGLFAPVFRMPKPTGPYRTGKTTRLWIDRSRRSWLMKPRRKLGQPPEHRQLMANVWYPAAMTAKAGRGREELAGEDADRHLNEEEKQWPDDSAAKAAHMAAVHADRIAVANTHSEGNGAENAVALQKATEKRMKELKKKMGRKGRKKRRSHWLDPTLATTLAESFEMPSWIVDYFRLVKMEAVEDAPVASPPPPRQAAEDGFTGGFPLVLFSHSFTGMKEQNSALLQELASWGHIVVAVDHPYDAALVLYPDGSTADFRGYDMPRESEPRKWWRFRHEHARWRALDLAHALERVVDATGDPTSPLYRKVDLSRISVIGHSFGGAAAVMLAQMDPRITSVVLLDPWMWPLGRESTEAGVPCPTLVFEAPEFLWNRDIFCVTNGEMSSLLCAATAPQAAAEGAFAANKRAAAGMAGGTGSREREIISGGRVEGEGAEGVVSPTPRAALKVDTLGAVEVGATGAASGSSPSSLASLRTSVANSGASPDGVLVTHTSVGREGFPGVGFYCEDGFYATSSPPMSPKSAFKGALGRPQHPRSASSEDLQSLLKAVEGEGDAGDDHGNNGSPVEGVAGGDPAAQGGATGEGYPLSSSSSGRGMPPRHPLSRLGSSGSSSGNALPIQRGGSWDKLSVLANSGAGETPSSSWDALWASLNGSGGAGHLRHRSSSFSAASLPSIDSSVMQRDPSGIAFKAVLKGTMHFDFTDLAVVAPLTCSLLGLVGVGGSDVHDIQSAAILRFLRQFNHPRAPDAAAPTASELECLRAGLLSHTPVASVGPAEQWGFSGGHAFGYHGPPPSHRGGLRRGGRIGHLPMRLPKIQLPLSKGARGVGKGGHHHHRPHQQQHHRHRGGHPLLDTLRDNEYRKSFDADYVPETNMELEAVPVPDVGTATAPTDPDTSYAPGISKSGPRLVHNDPGTENDPRTHPSSPRVDHAEGEGAGAIAVGIDGGSPSPQEARPRIVNWVKSHEWHPDPQREWDDAQRREMRWLMHDAIEKGTKLRSSDFIAMFPSFTLESIERCAVKELLTLDQHPPPKPLAWMSQLVIDGDGDEAGASGAVEGAASSPSE